MKGIGSSPLSNEICTAIIFVVLALIYWLIALTGKLPKGVRTVFGAIVALAGLVFSVFCGMAYQIETIASWCGPWTVVSMVGVALFGGVALCDVALACAGGLRAARQSYRTCAIVLFLVGLVVGFGGMGALVAATAGLASPLQSGGALVSGATPAIIAAVALGLIAAIGAIVGLVAGQTALQRPFWPAIIALIALFAILFARLVFYALQLGIGLN
jgi:DMSO reductase anchor subunit